jgi:hypothetical protein
MPSGARGPVRPFPSAGPAAAEAHPARGQQRDAADLAELFGLTYLQQISDANLKAGLHIEPGLWAAVPKTSNPSVPSTVVRLASIPHGTTVLLQGTASTAATGPSIPDIGIKPFTINQPNRTVDSRNRR